MASERSILFAAGLAAAVALPVAAQASVEISTGKTKHMVCDAGACVPSGKSAVLNVKDLAAMLAAGDLKVFTGNGALNIEITAPFSWTSGSRLTLSAYQSVNFKAAVTVAGTGAVTIATNVQGSGGDLYFTGGALSFWDAASSLIVNGNSYVLVNDIPTLAGAIANNPQGFFALAKDHDAFSDGIFPHAAIPTLFQGDFRGLGNAIDNLAINDTTVNENVGLFAAIDTTGTVSSLRLTHANVTAEVDRVGIVAGKNAGKISFTSVDGTLTGGGGGIVSENDGVILGAQSSADLLLEGGGGIAVENNGTIQSSHSSGTIRSRNGEAGGLVAENAGTIVESWSSAAVIVPSFRAFAGGLVARNVNGGIYRSFATGSVSIDNDGATRAGARRKNPQTYLGGLTGYSTGKIVDCYERGSVDGDPVFQDSPSALGGITGFLYNDPDSLKQVYATGALKLQKVYLGGLVGYDASTDPTVKENAYWDRDTTGVSDASKGSGNIVFDPHLKGVSTGALKKSLPKGFDASVWKLDPAVNDGYPYLIANPPQPQGAK